MASDPEGRKERNVLFNDALNTFYLRLYGVRHMVKDHSDSEKGNLLPPLHELLFLIMYPFHVMCNKFYCYWLKKEGSVLFNDALNTFYLQLYGVRYMEKLHSNSERGNPLHHMGYSFWLAARVLLYASSHRQDNTYHGLYYTSRGSLAGTRNKLWKEGRKCFTFTPFYWCIVSIKSS